MLKTKIILAASCAVVLGACNGFEEGLGGGLPSDKTVDRGLDRKHLSQLQFKNSGTPSQMESKKRNFG